jgi:formate hydrogenlyase transcriptional activator
MVAPTDANVLILGETGTGKELVARALHRISPRKESALRHLELRSHPHGLLESETVRLRERRLYRRLTQKIGRFEMAHRALCFSMKWAISRSISSEIAPRSSGKVVREIGRH